MVSISTCDTFGVMPKRKPLPSIDSEPMNIRVPTQLLARLDRYRERSPVRPTKTQCFLDALVEWLDKKEAQLPSKR